MVVGNNLQWQHQFGDIPQKRFNNPLFIPHSYFNTSTIDLPHSEFSTIDVINPYMFCNVSIPNNFISSGSSGLLRNGNLICGGRGWMALAFNDSNFDKIIESESITEIHQNYTNSDECLIPLTFPFVDENVTSSRLNCQSNISSRADFHPDSSTFLEHEITGQNKWSKSVEHKDASSIILEHEKANWSKGAPNEITEDFMIVVGGKHTRPLARLGFK